MVRTIRSPHGGLKPEGWPAAAASPGGFSYVATDGFNGDNNHVATAGGDGRRLMDAILRLADFRFTCSSNAGNHPYGLFYGESPLSYPFTLFLLEFSFIVFTIHVVRFLLKPFRQPRIIAEIVVSPRVLSISCCLYFSYLDIILN